MRKRFLLAVFLLLSLRHVQGQEITFYADVMINADHADNRKYASSIFLSLLKDRLRFNSSFNDSLEELKWISVQYPADSTFRTITWQIDEGDGDFHYYGFFQTSDGNLFETKAENGDQGLYSRGKINWTKWNGGLVYKIIQFEDVYTLFTFKQLNAFTKVKTCETIHWSQNKVELGASKFEVGEESSEFEDRLILKFSADSNVRLNFLQDSKRIVYDNLIAVIGRMEGQGPTQVPDGSYKGYVYGDHKWNNIDKLFDQILEEAPRAGISNKGRDLFGRRKN